MSRAGRSRVLRRLIIKSSRSSADADAASQALAAETEHYQEHLDRLNKFRTASHTHAKQTSELQLWMEELTYLQRQRGRLEREVSAHLRELILLDPSFSIPSEVMTSLQHEQNEIGLVKQIADIRDIFHQWRRKTSIVEKDHRSIIGELLFSCQNNVDEVICKLSAEQSKLEAEVGELRQMVILSCSYRFELLFFI